jgi:hypothetical protein
VQPKYGGRGRRELAQIGPRVKQHVDILPWLAKDIQFLVTGGGVNDFQIHELVGHQSTISSSASKMSTPFFLSHSLTGTHAIAGRSCRVVSHQIERAMGKPMSLPPGFGEQPFPERRDPVSDLVNEPASPGHQPVGPHDRQNDNGE